MRFFYFATIFLVLAGSCKSTYRNGSVLQESATLAASSDAQKTEGTDSAPESVPSKPVDTSAGVASAASVATAQSDDKIIGVGSLEVLPGSKYIDTTLPGLLFTPASTIRIVATRPCGTVLNAQISEVGADGPYYNMQSLGDNKYATPNNASHKILGVRVSLLTKNDRPENDLCFISAYAVVSDNPSPIQPPPVVSETVLCSVPAALISSNLHVHTITGCSGVGSAVKMRVVSSNCALNYTNLSIDFVAPGKPGAGILSPLQPPAINPFTGQNDGIWRTISGLKRNVFAWQLTIINSFAPRVCQLSLVSAD